MSEVKVNKISPRSGTTITLGDSGDTFTVPSGVTFDASSGGLAGTLTTAAQPNITSVGTLTSFTSTGIDDNATSTALTINSTNNATFSGIVTANEFNGGSLHSTINTSSVTVAGGTNSNVGANIGVYGGNHSSLASVTRFRAGSSETMRIDSSGNVGIGTSSPSEKLDVSGNINLTDSLLIDGAIKFEAVKSSSTGQDSIYKTATNTLAFNTGGSERMRIQNTGNVGIGTSSPSYKLDVPSVSGARLSLSNVFLGKEVTVTNGQTKTIDIATNPAGSYFKVIITGIYASNSGLFTIHEYEKVYVNSASAGGNSAISTVFSQNGGNFQFQAGDFAISRPGSGVVRIVYTENASNNGDIYLNVNVIGLGGRGVPSAITIT